MAINKVIGHLHIGGIRIPVGKTDLSDIPHRDGPRLKDWTISTAFHMDFAAGALLRPNVTPRNWLKMLWILAGRVTVEKFHTLEHILGLSMAPKGFRLRTFLDGEDVTDRCRECTPLTGRAVLYVLDPRTGKIMICKNAHKARTVIRYGSVEFRVTQRAASDEKREAYPVLF